MAIDVIAYRAKLEQALKRLPPQIDSGRIIGSDHGQFLLVEKGDRAVELYCGDDDTVVIDPAINEELQGEIEFPSYDRAISAAIHWLNGDDRAALSECGQ